MGNDFRMFFFLQACLNAEKMFSLSPFLPSEIRIKHKHV